MADAVKAHPSDTEVKANVDRASGSALASAKRNLTYLWNPSANAGHPGRLRTRALLRAFHYIGIFIFWRVVRYAKYAAVGAAVAALGATAFGSVFSGVAFVAAPPTMVASLGIGLVWAVGRWGFKKAAKKVQGVHREEEMGIRPARPIPEPTFLGDTFA